MDSLHIRQDASEDNGWADFKLWHYSPSISAAIVFAIIFLVLTGYHSFLLIRRRTWFCIPFVIGGLLETIGCVGRALAHGNTDSVSIYTMQTLCLLLAPILFAASVYMILGRIIRVTQGEEYSFIRVNWLTKIFVGGDIFCFMMQGAGGGLLSTADTKDKVDLGNNVILGGLILQIIIFLVFMIAAFLFQRKMSARPTSVAMNGPLGEHSSLKGGFLGYLTWKRLMLGLYLTSIMITVRNLFRVIEYGMGNGSYLLAHEWPLYVFDSLLMVGVLVICIIWYNPEISKGKKGAALHENHRLESQQGATQVLNVPSKAESSRPWS